MNLFSVILFVLLLVVFFDTVSTEINCVGDLCIDMDELDADEHRETGKMELVYTDVHNANPILKMLDAFDLQWIYHPLDKFLISSTEVTVGQFRQCVESGRCQADTFDADRPSCTYNQKQDNLPMNCVDYYGAEQFCQWVGGYLCSEDEWNAACQGMHVGQLYPYGKSFKEDACSVGTYEQHKSVEAVRSRAECVGGLDSLYDMGGSLSEWLGSERDDNYRKFKPISFAFNGPVDKNVCTNMCAGNQREFKSPSIGARCCKENY